MNPRPFELSCARARELASARADGELGDAHALDAHLVLCDGCRVFADELAVIAREVRGFASEFSLSSWPAIEARARALRTRRRLLRVAAALVGCVGTLAALNAADPTRDHVEADHASPLGAIATLAEPPTEQRQLADSPEHQLLLALAAPEERR